MKKMMILIVGFFAMVFATSGGAEIHVTEQTFRDAEKGNVEAQLDLGYHYLNDKRDIDKALIFLSAAAKQGHKEGLYGLGHCCELKAEKAEDAGNKTERDRLYSMALDYYLKSANKGDAKAHIAAAHLYYAGAGTEKNLDKAAELFYGSCLLGDRTVLPYLESLAGQGNEKAKVYMEVLTGKSYGATRSAIANTLTKKTEKLPNRQVENNNNTMTSAINPVTQTKTYPVAPKIETVEPVKGFNAPKVDSDIELELKDGRIVKGKCNKITQDKIYIDVDEGIIGYSRNDLSSNSRCKVFKPDYEKERARQASLQAAAQLQSVIQAAEHGNAEAQFTLGLYYCKGEYVTKNEVEAVKWWRKSAEQGYLRAQCELANCYAFGKYVVEDKAEAIKWYRKAAEQGNAEAQYLTGDSYANGVGVTQDFSEAVKWYYKAAEQGHVAAQYGLGVCYFRENGVKKDFVEAVKWIRKAAEQGDAKAQCSLGSCYYNGDGVPKDYTEAVKWYLKAAYQGDAKAQNRLFTCYSLGNGVAKDEAEAWKWLSKWNALDRTEAEVAKYKAELDAKP